MRHNAVSAYALCAWLASAVSGPLALHAAAQPWHYTLAVGLACGLLCWCIHAFSDDICMEFRWYTAAQWAWSAVAAGTVAHWSASAWPMGDASPAVPLVLLALAATSAWNGAQQASRVGGVMFWLLALLFSVLLAAGIKDVKLSWLCPERGSEPYTLVFCFLLPASAVAIPRQYRGVLWCTLLALVLFGTAVSALTAGVLSPGVSHTLLNPLYEYSRGLSLFGVAERFESVMCVALTMSFYSCLSLLLSCAGHLAENMREGLGRRGVAVSAAAAAVMVILKWGLPGKWLAVISIAVWCVLPVLAQARKRRKKSEKNENNA